MKKIILIIILSYVSCLANSQVKSNDYDGYKKIMKENYGVSINFPKNAVVHYKPEMGKNNILFGTYHKNLPKILPKFPVGPIVKLTHDCTIILVEKNNHEKPAKSGIPTIDEYYANHYFSNLESLVLNNCELPSSNSYYANSTGIILTNKDKEKIAKSQGKTLKAMEHERQEIINAAELCLKKHVRKVYNTEQNKTSNSDCIYIVHFPNSKKISCTNKSTYIEKVISSSTDCYGIEFFRADRYNSFVGMLVFLDSKGGKTINDYVEMICHYLQFKEGAT